MVAKIVMGRSIRGILHYNEEKVEKGQAQLLLASGFATDIEKLNFQQKLIRFDKRHQLNPGVKTNAMHISLNFDPSEKLDAHTLQQIAQTYMEQIGFGDQPYLVYQHSDAAHTHLHIATTLIQPDGDRKYTHHIGRLVSEPARKKIEEQFGLIRAEGRNQDFSRYIQPVIYGQQPTKQAINSVLLSVIGSYSFTSLAEFNAILGQFNIRAERGSEGSDMFQKKGLLYTVLDERGKPIGVPIKASRFYSQPTLSNLEKKFEKGIEQRKPLRENLKQRIDKVKGNANNGTRGKLVQALAKKGIDLVFRQNEKGLVYGVTFVDHLQRTVFNGSDLGKAYSAREFTEQFQAGIRNTGQPLMINPSQPSSVQPFNLLEVLLDKTAYEEPSLLQKRKKKRKLRGQNL